MPTIRYHIVPQGLMMSVNGDPTYWFDRKASLGLLWEHVHEDEVEILRHGRVEMIVERENSHRTFYAEIGAAAPKTGRAFVTVENMDAHTVDLFNRVLAGEVNPMAIVARMQEIGHDALRRVRSIQARTILAAA